MASAKQWRFCFKDIMCKVTVICISVHLPNQHFSSAHRLTISYAIPAPSQTKLYFPRDHFFLQTASCYCLLSNLYQGALRLERKGVLLGGTCCGPDCKKRYCGHDTSSWQPTSSTCCCSSQNSPALVLYFVLTLAFLLCLSLLFVILTIWHTILCSWLISEGTN